MKRTRGDSTTEEEESDVTMKGRRWSDTRKGLWVKECLRPPESTKGKGADCPLRGSRRTQGPTPWLSLREANFMLLDFRIDVCCWSHQVCGYLISDNRKLIQALNVINFHKVNQSMLSCKDIEMERNIYHYRVATGHRGSPTYLVWPLKPHSENICTPRQAIFLILF